MKKAVIYLRVSTGRQAEKELPLESQESQCRQKAAELGAEVVQVFSDRGISGRTDSRPEFQYSIQFCELRNIDHFITWSTSRFARSAVDAKVYKARLEKAGTEINYVSVNIDREDEYGGFLQESILEIFDELYSRQVSADTRRSMVKNSQSGYWKGGFPPFGYKIIPAPENPKRSKLVPHEIEADIVRRIFQMRIEGYGSKSIATKLNDLTEFHRGARWSKSAVTSVLRNERVVGRTIYGRKSSAGVKRPREQWIIVDSHEPLVRLDHFDQVQALMDEANTSGSPKSTWFFTGLVRCEKCGLAMRIESAKGRHQRYYYYNCSGAQKGMGCLNRRIPAADLDDWLVDMICHRIFSADNLRCVVQEMHDYYGDWAKDRLARRAGAQNELARIQTRQNRLYELLEDGREIDLSDIAPRLKANKESIRELEQRLVAIDLEQPPQLAVLDNELEELRAGLIGAIKASQHAQKVRGFFASFIDKIEIREEDLLVVYRPEAMVKGTNQAVVPSNRNWLHR